MGNKEGKQPSLMEEIEDVTGHIFDHYMKLAILESLGNVSQEAYQVEKRNLSYLREYEDKLYARLLSKPEEFQQMYCFYSVMEEDLDELEQLVRLGDEDTVCPYFRILIKLQNRVLFHDLQLKLPRGMKALGNSETASLFEGTFSAIHNSTIHDLTYISLLEIQDALENVSCSPDERLSLCRAKYYYISMSPRAESLFLEKREQEQEPFFFPKCPCLSKKLLERNQDSCFYSAYLSEHLFQILRYASIVMEQWLSYFSLSHEAIFISDLLLQSRMNAVLALADQDFDPSLEKLLEKVMEQMRFQPYMEEKNYGYLQIRQCFSHQEEAKQKRIQPMASSYQKNQKEA